jgi:hypothetical protein
MSDQSGDLLACWIGEGRAAGLDPAASEHPDAAHLQRDLGGCRCGGDERCVHKAPNPAITNTAVAHDVASTKPTNWM